MKLEETKQAFYRASETLSENARKLLFAGIAIVWILKVGGDKAGGIPFDKSLLLPLRVFIYGLGFDLAQYLYKTVAWWLYHRRKHKQGIAEDAEVDPTWINTPTWLLFGAKLFFCVIGFVALLTYISRALSH